MNSVSNTAPALMSRISSIRLSPLPRFLSSRLFYHVRRTAVNAAHLIIFVQQLCHGFARDRLLQKALDTITQNAQALASVPEAAPQAGAILRAVREIKE